MEWYLGPLKKYATLNGRATRKEYWLFYLFNLIISFVLGFIEGVYYGLNSQIAPDIIPLASIYSLVIIVPTIAVGVRRMHDTGRSGWWLLFPLVNIIFLGSDTQPDDNQYGSNPKDILNATAASPTQISIADQIRELAKLNDDGILSAEEFEAKKKELLNKV